MFDENEGVLREAIRKDLRSNELLMQYESQAGSKEAQFYLDNLEEFAASTTVGLPVSVQPGVGKVEKQPYGKVLIISPWNYPVSLLVKPLAGALAAGNTAVVKPSEVSAHVSAALSELFARYFDAGVVRCETGGPEVATRLLAQKWDYIFYTGSTNIGRVVMRAAAEHLTPVTLELGGKSPVIVDSSANLAVSARRIAWGKFVMNCGQTCVAPDYVMVMQDVADEFQRLLLAAVGELMAPKARESRAYSRIINERHVRRLAALVDPHPDQELLLGGSFDVDDHFFEPTVLRLPSLDAAARAPVMQDEIFGPVLPLIPIASVDDAVRFVNARPKPLALYVFAESSPVVRAVLDRTSSGGAAVNEVIMQIVPAELPFGGVGPSGMGAYNGRYTYDLFSHHRAVLSRPTRLDSSVRYPPYSKRKVKLVQYLSTLTLPSLSLCPLRLFKSLKIPLALLFAFFLGNYYRPFSKM